MLTNVKISKYKSLFDVNVNLEPLTVLIGPNGSGKSSFCESLDLLSELKRNLPKLEKGIVINHALFHRYKMTSQAFKSWAQQKTLPDYGESIFWHNDTSNNIIFTYDNFQQAKVYNFVPYEIMNDSIADMSTTGTGIANSLTKILFDNRKLFMELEQRFIELVPNIAEIKLDQVTKNNSQINTYHLIDKYSGTKISAAHISDGTLRLLAFLVALYDVTQPEIICFEEPENGIHPWLLNKIMKLMKQVSEEGITGKPTQIIITTHSPVLLNYVEPKQIRAVELDTNGATQINALPTDSKRFQKAMEAYDGELGELWFTNIFGANPV